MEQVSEYRRDPVWWHAGVALIFLALASVRLTIPSALYFDEVHYIPAVREMVEMFRPVNEEHPLLAKQLLALGVILFGDNALGWRIMPLLFGTLAIYAGMRAMWFAAIGRFASFATGILLATGFPLLVHSRIAMLDVFMVAFLMVALWQCAAAMRQPETGRWRLAIAGAALGAAMASKWNAVPIAIMPGLAFLAVRLRESGAQFLTARRAAPVPGMTLLEAGVWLGALPLLVYFLSFWPLTQYTLSSLPWGEVIAYQSRMMDLQTQTLPGHTYQSVWYEWVGNWRAIWYLYEEADGAQRGILLLGNPLTMLLGLPALAWCAWAGFTQRRMDALGIFILYAVSIGFWIVAAKSTQFYYHYFVPSCFLLAALALALAELRNAGWRKTAYGTLVASGLVMAYYFPILTAAPLEGPMSFLDYAWLESWR
ncbi:glycosyltransferase family 39 protein [Paraurantiacibacter namhicola]|uniref:Putative dolichyl-phosphate-mannose--protein mannosyltransferase n=1 Tax=Paraurantiacibacter namhicola TaxID=645517 RepID=A0A1C7D8B0_9SPHN|nr:glycosyltransferase family 39 protein [Paraurantiacibacter namhicola]ANU07592.1 putative dolichyl-phosphate-mannose--protein mannosyltransferase [Paraurantiacibacter namhicola]